MTIWISTQRAHLLCQADEDRQKMQNIKQEAEERTPNKGAGRNNESYRNRKYGPIHNDRGNKTNLQYMEKGSIVIEKNGERLK